MQFEMTDGLENLLSLNELEEKFSEKQVKFVM